MEFTTERLILRPWTIADAEDLYNYAKDERVGPIAGWAPHKSVEESAEIIQTVFAQKEVYAVALKENNRAIGCIGILIGKNSNFEITETEGEVAYWIGVPFWGQGLIPEALNKIIEHAFETLKLTKLWCGFFKDNEKSKRAQEKCGFKHSHIIEKQFNPFLNDYQVEYVSRLTKAEWQNK
ncbi:GNAT family N-acetyltransferase [Empedobacter tilapiae]|uniref:N-acetyltransferase n=1 Tax=Empedobacter tilapiae TaxID=2491114 RepID=A0A4Z1BK77_9FLAO|nr:GNAT family N-acetyltransferase [Empedobacter tilapiae]TGN28007.1 N-acetyltransferase [Empedobacter tilapiae]